MLDIIIVNYESSGFLNRCLRSIYDSTVGIPINVFVQDNSSKNGIDHVGDTFPQINLTKNDYNMGFAKAVNRALAQSSAPYVLLLNPDTVLTDGFFESSLQYADDNQDVGIMGTRILNLDGTIQGSARCFPTPLTGIFGRSTLLTRLFPNNRFTRANILTTRSDGITPMDVDWVSGASLLLRRKALDDVGYLDDRFFLYWEDTDLCKRMWQKGWKVVYFPQATVYHYVGGSTRKKPIRSILEFHKSVYRLFDKYNNPSLRFLNPFVISALALRLALVLFINRIGAWHGKLQSFMEASALRNRQTRRKSNQSLRGNRWGQSGVDDVERRGSLDRRSGLDRRKGLDRRGIKGRRKRDERSKVIEMKSRKYLRNGTDRRSSKERRATFAM